MNFVIGLYRPVIDQYETIVDSILDFCPRDVGEPVHKEFVDPHQLLPAVNDNPMVFK